MSHIVLCQNAQTNAWEFVGFSTKGDPKEAIREATRAYVRPARAYVALEWKPKARCVTELHLKDVPPNGSEG